MPMPRPGRFTAIYARVSSRKQDTASQEPDLARWMERNPELGPFVPFDDQFSGKTMKRPGWDAVWSEVLAGRCERVVIWRLDRLGRTTPQLSALFAALIARKVDLVSMREGIALATPTGLLIAHILASVAQFETEVRGERVAAGLEVARAKGKVLGRPAGSTGRTKVTAEKEALIRRLKAEGEKVAVIARVVSLHRDTVYSVLATPG